MVYVHGDFIDNKIYEYGRIMRSGPYRGTQKNGPLARRYELFKNNKYIPMRQSVWNMQFDADDVDSFNDCAVLLNSYYADVRTFMRRNGISCNSKFHTNFLEEFSVYFLNSLISQTSFDIFNSDIFAGLKIDTGHNISQIRKDVDFCVGKEININFDGIQETVDIDNEPTNIITGGRNEVFRIPAISVEVKTYVDATMLGEVMNTSRKIKGANPGSKSILLTCSLDFADEHLLEAAYDSSIDEIIVLGTKKRHGNNDVIEFTKEGLCGYYKTFEKAIRDVVDNDIYSRLGQQLAYIRHLA